MRNWNVKRILAGGLLATALFTGTAFASAVPADVIGEPVEEAVAVLFERGIITGDENGLFNPGQNLTRAQACIIVVKSMNPPVGEVAGTATQAPASSGFPDMSGYSWAEGYIGYAVRNGITKGYPDGSFKPGNKVTSNELATMILRAAGHSDVSLGGTWPDNYTGKALELGLYDGLPAKDEMPDYAAKWMAAQMNYNALDLIDKAQSRVAEKTWGIPAQAPTRENLEFVLSGRFNAELSSFGGVPIVRDAQILSHGLKKDFNREMVLSEKASDFQLKSIFQYKNVVSPALIRIESGHIVQMVLPADAGFTGQAYSVVNQLSDGILSLTAGQEMRWSYGEGAKTISSSREAGEGTLYRLSIADGRVTAAAPQQDMKMGFRTISEYRINGPIQVETESGNQWIEVTDAPTIYVLDPSAKFRYRTGKVADIRPGAEVKLFDISDNGLDQADIIIVRL
jgi:hypothetical protein